MTRLIVTTDSSAAGAIQQAGLADLVIAIEHRLVWGPLPSKTECDAFFSPRTAQPNGLHWLDATPFWRLERSGVRGRGLIDLVSECSSAELWMGPEPNAQLLLLWLLDYCGTEEAAVSKLSIRHLDLAVGDVAPAQSAKMNPPVVKLTQDHERRVGGGKARERRAHHSSTHTKEMGTLRFAPYETPVASYSAASA